MVVPASMSAPRFYVATTTGYPISVTNHQRLRSEAREGAGITAIVIDRVHAHREVAAYTSGHLGRARALRKADRLCDRLNQETPVGPQEAA